MIRVGIIGATVIMVSAGKLGHQIACDPKALLALVRADTADIITEG